MDQLVAEAAALKRQTGQTQSDLAMMERAGGAEGERGERHAHEESERRTRQQQRSKGQQKEMEVRAVEAEMNEKLQARQKSIDSTHRAGDADDSARRAGEDAERQRCEAGAAARRQEAR